MTDCILITGGVKSGKSKLGMACMESLTDKPCIVATARKTDGEMSRRIERHQQERGEHWDCIECPIDLPEVLTNTERPVLVDCLGVWLTNCLVEQPHTLEKQISDLTAAIKMRQHATVFISNETGLGVIGADALTRQFVDELGLLNQQIAQLSSLVALTVSGLPIWLKGKPTF